MFPVPTIDKAFNEEGVPADPEAMDKKAGVFIHELLYWIKAKQRAEA